MSFYDSHTYRSITAIRDNYIAYKNLVKIIKQNDISIIHCNTPVGGLIGRLVGKKHRVKKVIYTAHGFHFYKGAPFINKTVYKMAEKVMARWTDAIITMNREDYEAAKKFKTKKGGKIYLVHGVGIDLLEYNLDNVNRTEKRKELGFEEEDVLCIAAGDIIKRKNYSVAIKAIANTNNKKIHYLICGIGPEKDNLVELSKEMGIENQIHFLGFRKDIKELLCASDIFLFTSLQEGLPRSVMEAMAVGLPMVLSKVRGNVDLVEDNKGGFLLEVDDYLGLSKALEKLAEDIKLREKMGKINKNNIKNFDVNVVEKEIEDIYREVF